MNRLRNGKKGFTLIEMMVSLCVFLIVAGAVIGVLSTSQKNYQSVNFQAQLEQSMRATLEMMAQDIGQAGALPGPLTTVQTTTQPTSSTTLAALVVANTTVFTLNGGYFFAGEQVFVDTGAAQEEVTIATITGNAATTTAATAFKNIHAAGAPVFAVGVFLNGIRTPKVYMGSNATGYYSNELDLYGDIHGDGSLTEVFYYCNTATNTLTRQEITYPATSTSTPAAVLLSKVTNCTTTATSGVFHYGPSPGYNLYPNVSVTLTAQAPYANPQNGQTLTLTHSMLNVQPRNMLAGYNRISGGDTTEDQPDPMASTYPNGVLVP